MSLMLAWSPSERPTAEEALNSNVTDWVKETWKTKQSGEKRGRANASDSEKD